MNTEPSDDSEIKFLQRHDHMSWPPRYCPWRKFCTYKHSDIANMHVALIYCGLFLLKFYFLIAHGG